ncbi:hypothetical protein HK101_007322, partial [Irineochytrium annulatum]
MSFDYFGSSLNLVMDASAHHHIPTTVPPYQTVSNAPPFASMHQRIHRPATTIASSTLSAAIAHPDPLPSSSTHLKHLASDIASLLMYSSHSHVQLPPHGGIGLTTPVSSPPLPFMHPPTTSMLSRHTIADIPMHTAAPRVSSVSSLTSAISSPPTTMAPLADMDLQWLHSQLQNIVPSPANMNNPYYALQLSHPDESPISPASQFSPHLTASALQAHA